MPTPPPSDDTVPCRLVRATRPVDGVEPGRFLAASAGLPRGFWQRDGRWTAWAGSAARVTPDSASDAAEAARSVRDRAERMLSALEAVEGSDDDARRDARLHGGLAFDPGDSRSPEPGFRQGFPGALFHLPALELRGGEDGVRLAAIVRLPGDADDRAARRAARRALERCAARLAESPASGDGQREGRPAAACTEVVRRPGPGAWTELVEEALRAVRSGGLEKVVPARLLELALDRAPDPVALLARLRRDNPGTFPFLFEPGPGPTLLGAAPEIVAARADGRFEATAVAGTVPEGEGREERERMARRLLASEKDRTEHEVGVRDMREALLSVAGVAEVDAEPSVLRLRGMQHLCTHLSARVPDSLHVLELLGAMHPTAAVNGRPRERARDFLREREPFHRGWFAGPVGWFDGAGDGAFAPALRSALVDGERVLTFAGAGIVEGSRPEAEWEETSVKLLPVLRALELDPDAVAQRIEGRVATGARG